LASIFKRIVQRFNARQQKGPSEGVFAAAFGKHPAWDDHIDDIGLQTDFLVAVKRILYIQGIGGNVDAGSWDKLGSDQLVEKFGHLFVWCINGVIVVGRLWPSRDGKGRTSYPMVVCVQCPQLPLSWVFENILPRLKRIEEACNSTNSTDDVRKIIEDAQNQFRQLTQQWEPGPNLSADCSGGVLTRLAQLPEMGPDRQGLHRILYHIDREVLQAPAGTGKGQELRPTSVRVPSSCPAVNENALLWISFLRARFGPNTPILVLMPTENPWMDIVIGEPTDLHLFCLRASLGAVPLTSSIPYHMGAEFVARVNQLIDTS
jgi:hypothetical protein